MSLVATDDGAPTPLTATNMFQLVVAKAVLVVTAEAQSRVVGAANPTLTVTLTGFRNGEVLATSDVTGSPG